MDKDVKDKVEKFIQRAYEGGKIDGYNNAEEKYREEIARLREDNKRFRELLGEWIHLLESDLQGVYSERKCDVINRTQEALE